MTKWPGLKFGCWTSKRPRTACEVAQDNITASNPPPNPKEIQRLITKTALALVELEKAILKMKAAFAFSGFREAVLRALNRKDDAQ